MFQNHLTTILRNLRKRKVFSMINIAGLSVGLASSMLILLYVHHELSYDDYHERAGRIFRVTRSYDLPSGYNHHFARVPDDWVNELPGEFPEIDRLVRLQQFRTPHIKVGEAKFREEHVFATDPYIFEVFSFPLVKGDAATALTRPNSVVLTESIAGKYFGEREALGQTIELLGADQQSVRRYTVTGVMADLPSTSHFDVHLLTSLSNPEERTGWAYVYLLLRPGADAGALAAKFPGFIDGHVDEENASRFNQLHLQPITDIHLHSHLARELQPNGSITSVYIFALVALFILLLAGVNFVNLSIAQSAERSRELGIRKILGSSRRRLIAYLLGESCFFAFIAFGLALVLIYYALPFFHRITGAELGFWNVGVLATFLLATVLTGLLAGLYPAVRISAIDLIKTLKNETVIAVSGRRLPLRKALVVLQFTISIGLIICTAVTYRQFEFLQNKNLGFNKDQVIAIPDLAPAAQKAYYTFKEQIRGLAGVKSVSAAMEEPSNHIRDTGNIFAEGKTDEDNELVMDILPVDYNFLDLMEIELAAGETFRPRDESIIEYPEDARALFDLVNSAERTYILNEAAVAAIGWETPQEALGKSFSWSNVVIDFQRGPIIGVAKDFNFTSLHNAVRPIVMVYEPRFFGAILVKVAPGHLDRTLAAIKAQWDDLLPAYAFEYRFLDDMFAQLYYAEKRQAGVLGLFAAIAVFIASLGILGLAAIAAKQRRKEIGIRKIVGASVRQIVQLLAGEFVRLILVSILIAWPVAYLLMRKWLAGFAYHTDLGPALFLLTGLATIAVALLAVGWQALWAARMNPVDCVERE
jgi:putative ABC transport system permease protein